MKEKNTVSRSRAKEGAPQMSKGRIGENANLDSHIANPAMWMTETMSKA